MDAKIVHRNIFVEPVEESEKFENEGILMVKCMLVEPYPYDNRPETSIFSVPKFEDLLAITHLNLSRCHLSVVPESLTYFEHLLVFDISYNLFQKIPEFLKSFMPRIKKINLCNNRLESFDFMPACVKSLKVLDISFNNLYYFPNWLGKAVNLEEINIGNNPLSKDGAINTVLAIKKLNIADCRLRIDDLMLLDFFPEVETLILSSSFLFQTMIYLPVDVLSKLKKLKHLEMMGSEMATMAGANRLENLTTVNFDYNCLKEIPVEFTLLKNLKVCRFAFNLLENLPEELSRMEQLEEIFLENNFLRELPEAFSTMPLLKVLDVYNNMIKEVPKYYMKFQYFDMCKNNVDEPDDEHYKKIRCAYREKYNQTLRYNTRIFEEEPLYSLIDLTTERSSTSEEEEEEENPKLEEMVEDEIKNPVSED